MRGATQVPKRAPLLHAGGPGRASTSGAKKSGASCSTAMDAVGSARPGMSVMPKSPRMTLVMSEPCTMMFSGGGRQPRLSRHLGKRLGQYDHLNFAHEPGLRSRCTMPKACMRATASTTRVNMRRTVSSVYPDVGWCRTAMPNRSPRHKGMTMWNRGPLPPPLVTSMRRNASTHGMVTGVPWLCRWGQQGETERGVREVTAR